jgi:hypothetical protein
VSDDNDVGGLEDPVQRLDGRFLFRSIHVGTLFGWRQDFLAESGPPVAPAVLEASVLAPYRCAYRSGRTTTKACPPDVSAEAVPPGAKVRTDTAGLSAGISVSPRLCRSKSIKPEAGTCSLGQDAFPNT